MKGFKKINKNGESNKETKRKKEAIKERIMMMLLQFIRHLAYARHCSKHFIDFMK